jgi:hypothetical protein
MGKTQTHGVQEREIKEEQKEAQAMEIRQYSKP